MKIDRKIHDLNYQIENLRCRINCLGDRAPDISAKRRLQHMINIRLIKIEQLEKKKGKGLFNKSV